ncbi:ABC transporter ATP-binding protein [Gudongella sp. SC589]|uniref:ABC transporter ATP-binding protein n=1 Tax=Gudongella sp. SC589 TaxID=3385990 RepID=UPI0039049973
MENIVEIKGLNKRYDRKEALRNIDLSIEKGKVVGILGPNGSGKTTLIKLLMGLLHPNTGEIRIDGQSPGVHTKSVISYLPDRNPLYSWMSVKDAIQMFQEFYQDFDEKKAEGLLQFMKLDRTMKVSNMSKGMKEKLNLALVLSRRAKVYILDEPIAGVDPVARDQILDAIIDNYKEDSAMIITTHLVRDMENIFDQVVFLGDGEIILSGEAERLREDRNMQIDGLYKEIFG